MGVDLDINIGEKSFRAYRCGNLYIDLFEDSNEFFCTFSYNLTVNKEQLFKIVEHWSVNMHECPCKYYFVRRAMGAVDYFDKIKDKNALFELSIS